MTTYTAGQSGSEHLAAGKKLTFTLTDGNVQLHRFSDGAFVEGYAITSTADYGPYFEDMVFRVSCNSGTAVSAIADFTDEARKSTGGVLAAPTITAPVLAEVASLNLTNDVTISVADGVPEDAVRATLSRNPAGDDNALTFTAVAYGAVGNSITIAYVDPAAADAVLSVSVVGSAITVNLATDELEAITSTAADVLAAIEAEPAADALVTVAIDAADSGVADDGSGVVTALAAAPMTGGEGTGIGTAGPGSLCVDYTNADLYVNGGTLAVPVWKLVTRAA